LNSGHVSSWPGRSGSVHRVISPDEQPPATIMPSLNRQTTASHHRATRWGRCAAIAGLLAGGVLGCVLENQRSPQSPANGASPWVQIESPHFMMCTDVPVEVAQRRVVDFEFQYSMLVSALPHPEGAPGQKISIVLFERSDDFLTITGVPNTVAAFFRDRLEGDLEAAPTLVLRRGESFSEAGRVFLHELTHSFLRQRGARLPRWLDEGLAQYYSTLQKKGGRLLLGEALPGRRFGDSWQAPPSWSTYRAASTIGRIPFKAAPSVPELLAAGPEQFYGNRLEEATGNDPGLQLAFYAAAFRLVHLLRNAPGAGAAARFDAFVASIESGTSSERAFTMTYGDAASQDLDAYYRSYLGLVDLRALEMPFRPWPGDPRTDVRLMTNSQVLVLQSRLRPLRPANAAQARKDLDEAVSLEPSSPEMRYCRALLALREKRFDDARLDLDAALAASPWDPRYLLGRAVTGRSIEGAPSATSSSLLGVYAALAQVAGSPAQLNELAWALALLGRPADGLPFAERALAADSTCARCEDTRAVLLFALGRVPEALASMDRAVALLPENRPSRAYVLRRRVLQLAASLLSKTGSAPQTGLSTEVLAAVARSYAPILSACPEQQALSPPVVRALVGPDGGVRSARPVASVAGTGTVACTLRAALGMIFPPFQGAPIEVTLPPERLAP
jgi:tetratricopeptide (TPR) repeat protein